jgi:hypothetical protein
VAHHQLVVIHLEASHGVVTLCRVAPNAMSDGQLLDTDLQR